MSLNIKNEETHRLVRELATLTGQSQTAAVEDAVRRRLCQLRADSEYDERSRRVMEIAEEMQAIAKTDPEWMATDWESWLYDENGLPR